jgi:predicted SPOUT superfamily RNA methylase MTH1
VVSLVRKDNFVAVHAEIHNKRDELQKTFDVRKLDRVSGIWTVLEMVMADAPQHTRTELVVEKVEYNVGLKETDFSRRELERGAGR